MPKPSQLAKIDNRMNGFLTVIEVRQRQYFAENGEYFQGLRSHTATPKATDTPPDNLQAHPHDRPTSWADVAPDFPGKTMSNIEMHISSTPGYTVILTTEIEGVEWRRLIGFEGDTGRSMDWYEVIDEFA